MSEISHNDKFQNMKRGEMMKADSLISDFFKNICGNRKCAGCPFLNVVPVNVTCKKWINSHKLRALQIMGPYLIEKYHLYPYEPSFCDSENLPHAPQKPPLGIEPEYIWKKQRYDELCGAIGRYFLEGLDILPEWIDEGKKLEKEIRGHGRE